MDRLLWQSANADGTAPLATDAYDDTTAGNQGIGRLTTEGYASGPSQSVTGTYSYVYDGRGRPTSTSLSIQGPGAPQATYTVGATYDDADRPVTLSLPATGDLPAETLTYAYDDGDDGRLASLTSSLTSPTGTLFQLPTYTSQGLLSGWKSGVTSGNPAWQASVALGYDGDLRVTDAKLTRTDTISGLSLPISEVQPSYDAAGNVSSVTTTLAAVGSTPGGSETQAFCYDDLDRLTWAGTSGTGPCGRAGSEGISGAGYTATYAYDTLDRITIETQVCKAADASHARCILGCTPDVRLAPQDEFLIPLPHARHSLAFTLTRIVQSDVYPHPGGTGQGANTMQADKQDVLKRLNYIEGHLGGIRKMVEEDKYCVDILRQTYAVRKAIEKLEALILENHLHGCVPDGIKNGREEAVIDELVQLYNLAGNR